MLSTPNIFDSCLESMVMPSFFASSYIFNAIIIFLFRDINCVLKNKFRSKFVESAMFSITSNFSLSKKLVVIFSSCEYSLIEYMPGKSIIRIL